MPSAGPAHKVARPVDATALAHIRRRLDRAAEPPWLHTEVARRMAERLPVVRQVPSQVLDWHAHRGGSREGLQRTYPKARIWPVEATARPDAAAERPWWQRWRGAASSVLVEASLGATPVPPAQLLWANMALHLAPDPLALMRQWQPLVAVDGFVMFSTLGPGTLQALTRLYARQGWPPPLAPLVDMHDLGDMLLEAGFADPVMDQETLTLHWADGHALLAELRSLGGNAHAARFAGLRTPRWAAQLQQLLQQELGQPLQQAPSPRDARPALDFEIVYGHAFKPAPRPRVAPVTTVDVETLRTMARAGPRRSPQARDG
jgi:malonyl-CoA O-methyltransferase